VWTGWDSAVATGVGTVDIQGCVPDCASGSQTPTPVTITVTDLRDGTYHELVEAVQGRPPVPYDAHDLETVNG
jgi:hypothetical protein